LDDTCEVLDNQSLKGGCEVPDNQSFKG